MKIYLNGQLVGKEQAVVSVFDHGLLYGDGVFEGIRVYGGRVFLHQEHTDRLYESAKAIRLEIPLTEEAENGLLDGVRGQPAVSEHELIDIRTDCVTILATLPEDLLEIAELLKELSPSDIARRLNISKSQVSRRMAKLRQHFAAEGYGHGGDSHETSTQENT